MLPYDFYLPSLNLVIEIQGAEHYEFIPVFHGTEQGFINRQLIDHLKESFAEDNDYNYLAVDGRQTITKLSLVHLLKEWTQHAKFRRSLPTSRKTGRLYGAEMD